MMAAVQGRWAGKALDERCRQASSWGVDGWRTERQVA